MKKNKHHQKERKQKEEKISKNVDKDEEQKEEESDKFPIKLYMLVFYKVISRITLNVMLKCAQE
jgi:hypothetical protein